MRATLPNHRLEGKGWPGSRPGSTLRSRRVARGLRSRRARHGAKLTFWSEGTGRDPWRRVEREAQEGSVVHRGRRIRSDLCRSALVELPIALKSDRRGVDRVAAARCKFGGGALDTPDTDIIDVPCEENERTVSSDVAVSDSEPRIPVERRRRDRGIHALKHSVHVDKLPGGAQRGRHVVPRAVVERSARRADLGEGGSVHVETDLPCPEEGRSIRTGHAARIDLEQHA